MKTFLILFAFVASSSSAFAQGSHGGNGGDIRRFRAARARSVFVHALSNMVEASHGCDLSPWNPNKVLLADAFKLYQWGSRTKIRWTDMRQSQCLVMQFRPADVLLTFSYASCPLPTPKNFYVQAIAAQFFKQFYPDQNPAQVFEDFRTILGGAKASHCLHESDIHAIPAPQTYKPTSFTNQLNAISILEAGRSFARRILSTIVPDKNGGAFNQYQFTQPINSFLVRSKKTFDQEVNTERFIVNDDDTASCSVTSTTLGAPIYFSTKKCVDFQTDADVAWVILHETTHHFGIDAETFADGVATEIMNIDDGFLVEPTNTHPTCLWGMNGSCTQSAE
ncbi:MAG: hypothetical protein JST80_04045 [Bdellovibrionales bacterium]|nr:hypothetical protein [Bdellovibrionales bacterium]